MPSAPTLLSTFGLMLEHQDQKIPRSVACPNCLRHKEQCICEKVAHLKNKTRVVILQHPQEQFKQFNSAKLLSLSLENSELVVGLSWQNHRAVLGEDCQPGEWGVLHLKGGKDPSGPPLEVFRKGKAKDPKDCGLKGIIVLDGSWKQAKTLWWRNPWLLRLNRVSLNPAHASLRNQVRPDKLSTLEAVSMVLELMGEVHAVQESLLEQYRALIIEPSKR